MVENVKNTFKTSQQESFSQYFAKSKKYVSFIKEGLTVARSVQVKILRSFLRSLRCPFLYTLHTLPALSEHLIIVLFTPLIFCLFYESKRKNCPRVEGSSEPKSTDYIVPLYGGGKKGFSTTAKYNLFSKGGNKANIEVAVDSSNHLAKR